MMVFEHSWPKLTTVSFDRLLPGDVYFGSLNGANATTPNGTGVRLFLHGRVVSTVELAPEKLSNHTVKFVDGSHDLPWKSTVAIIEDRRKGGRNAQR